MKLANLFAGTICVVLLLTGALMGAGQYMTPASSAECEQAANVSHRGAVVFVDGSIPSWVEETDAALVVDYDKEDFQFLGMYKVFEVTGATAKRLMATYHGTVIIYHEEKAVFFLKLIA